MHNNEERFVANFFEEGLATNPKAIENNSIDNLSIREKIKKSNLKPKPKIVFLAYKENCNKTHLILMGQVARTLKALIDKGNCGCTAKEVSGWSFALASYISTLRNKYGLKISTDMEPHINGFHGRYRLLDSVEIVETFNL